MKLIFIVFALASLLSSYDKVDYSDSEMFMPYEQQIPRDTIYPQLEATGPEWPDAIPLDIPQFSDGTMLSVEASDSGSDNIWTIKYGDVVKNTLSNYRDLLVVNDFKCSEINTKSGESKFTATQDGIKVVSAYGNGMVVLTITSNF